MDQGSHIWQEKLATEQKEAAAEEKVQGKPKAAGAEPMGKGLEHEIEIIVKDSKPPKARPEAAPIANANRRRRNRIAHATRYRVQITSEVVKKLRDKTGVGMMDCKKALEETGGDFEKAVEILRKKGIDVANKRSGRQASQGTVASYIHMGGKIGVLVEVNCESDFVAKSEDFNNFVKAFPCR